MNEKRATREVERKKRRGEKGAHIRKSVPNVDNGVVVKTQNNMYFFYTKVIKQQNKSLLMLPVPPKANNTCF